MPLKIDDIKKYDIRIAEKNDVLVWVGPCTAKKMDFKTIPLDGRKYECGGTVFLSNGLDLQASFRIQKTFDALLLEDTIYTKVDGVWYKLNEPAFFEKTGLERDDIFPLEWIPDIPIEHKNKGPYSMGFTGE